MTTAEVTWAGSVDLDDLRAALSAAYPAACEFLVPDARQLRSLAAGGGSRLPAPLAWSVEASRALGGVPATFDPTGLRWQELELGEGRTGLLLLGGFPESVWQRVGLPDHEHDPGAAALAKDLARACRHLQDVHGPFAELLLGLAPTLVLARLRPEVTNEPCLTSASLPVMPGVVYVSRKVLRHVPPSTVADTPLVPLASENLLHEAVHQLVNLVLLTRPVLPPDYSARTSPTIPIAWRSDQDVERNKRWELDRVLHATAVYVAVVRSRVAELATLPREDAAARWLRAAYPDGVAALDYLSSKLVEHAAWFDRHGANLVRALRHDAERVMVEV